ncbi:MAG: LptF/LptG family permease [Helicobacteraceae bacterium]|jgi:lipopolysaccharide export system permease protein|nr:LptF/LptG family permease [Helicobacteraceae bacterium]
MLKINLLQRYIISIYIKNTALVAAALMVFFVGNDLINNLGSLPDSVNLVFLYALFRLAKSLEVVLPLSLIFAAILTQTALIRQNELVAAHSLGASRGLILGVLFGASLIISLAFIALQATQFAYLGDYAESIRKRGAVESVTKDLFIRYDNRFIFIRELKPLQNEAIGIDVLEIKNGDLARQISAKRGVFDGDEWLLKEITIVHKPPVTALGGAGSRVERLESLRELSGFRPDVMETIYEQKIGYNITDAARALRLFAEQSVNTERIRAVLYAAIVIPLFSPLFAAILAVFSPISPRLYNVAIFSSLAVLGALVAWGALYALAQVARNGATLPEIALLLPFAISSIATIYIVRRATITL